MVNKRTATIMDIHKIIWPGYTPQMLTPLRSSWHSVTWHILEVFMHSCTALRYIYIYIHNILYYIKGRIFYELFKTYFFMSIEPYLPYLLCMNSHPMWIAQDSPQVFIEKTWPTSMVISLVVWNLSQPRSTRNIRLSSFRLLDGMIRLASMTGKFNITFLTRIPGFLGCEILVLFNLCVTKCSRFSVDQHLLIKHFKLRNGTIIYLYNATESYIPLGMACCRAWARLCWCFRCMALWSNGVLAE